MEKKKINLFLLILNGVLLCAGWVLTLYAYPRLPQKIPFWLNFDKQQAYLCEKSLAFFFYPAAQSLFFIFFLLTGRILASKIEDSWKQTLSKEHTNLSLIFFNLIFIHIERSLILLAHEIERGVDTYYFYSLFGIILILIPYYRLRTRILRK